MFLKLAIPILLGVCIVVPASADKGNCTKKYKALAVQEIQKARANGWTKIGDTDLATIEAEVASPTYFMRCDENITLVMDTRKTAMYFQNTRTIHFNKDLKHHAEPTQAAISLHESLGVKGFEDNQFQITTRIRQMQKTPFKPNSILEGKPSKSIRKGGSTGVGGGGDGDMVEYKTILFEGFTELLKDKPEDVQRTTLEEVLNINFRVFKANLAYQPAHMAINQSDRAIVEFGHLSIGQEGGARAFWQAFKEAIQYNLELDAEASKN